MRRLLALCACARALSPRELVAAHVAKRGAVEFAPRSRWAPDVRFSSAAGGFAGAAELAAAADFWAATEELEGFAWCRHGGRASVSIGGEGVVTVPSR